MITAMSLTNGTLTVIIDNGTKILTARNDHPKWNEIVDAFKAENEPLLQALISLKAVVETYSVGELSINTTGVTYKGNPVHSVDATRIMAFLKEGLPYKPLANYMARKMANPSARAITELYNFLEHKNMPITPEGKIIAYKGVRSDFYSVHGNKTTVVKQGTVDTNGRIFNCIGATIEVERSSVDDDFRHGCSFGLHAGSLSYAKGWGNRVVLVEIDPADVVSVPADCNCQKLRCCKYKIIGEYTGPMPEHFTNEFSDDDEEDICSRCGDVDMDCSCNSKSDLPLENTTQESSSHSKCSNSQSVVNPDKNILNDVACRCRKVISDITWINEIDIKDNSKFIDELGFDSLDAVEVTMGLEEEFKIEIGDNDVEALTNSSFSDLVNYIYTRVNVSSITPDVGQNSDECEAAYVKGVQAGRNDKSYGKSPIYLNGDQNGSDSSSHYKFIEGYINGYAQ